MSEHVANCTLSKTERHPLYSCPHCKCLCILLCRQHVCMWSKVPLTLKRNTLKRLKPLKPRFTWTMHGLTAWGWLCRPSKPITRTNTIIVYEGRFSTQKMESKWSYRARECDTRMKRRTISELPHWNDHYKRGLVSDVVKTFDVLGNGSRWKNHTQFQLSQVSQSIRRSIFQIAACMSVVDSDYLTCPTDLAMHPVITRAWQIMLA